jgi:hypothetical protein
LDALPHKRAVTTKTLLDRGGSQGIVGITGDRPGLLYAASKSKSYKRSKAPVGGQGFE